MNGAGGVDDRQSPPGTVRAALRVDQHAQAGAVDEIDRGEVELDLDTSREARRPGERHVEGPLGSQVELTPDGEPEGSWTCGCVDVDHQLSRYLTLTRLSL